MMAILLICLVLTLHHIQLKQLRKDFYTWREKEIKKQEQSNE